VNKDKKPLSETHPELAKEAYGWDPKSIRFKVGKQLEMDISDTSNFVD
jgi:hypothetical protein